MTRVLTRHPMLQEVHLVLCAIYQLPHKYPMGRDSPTCAWQKALNSGSCPVGRLTRRLHGAKAESKGHDDAVF